MEKALLLAIAASLCTATASVCQRLGARSDEAAAFDVWLVFRLARRPVWLLGIASMILGFALQLSALRHGALALVQPILALELLFVFGYLASQAPGGSRSSGRTGWPRSPCRWGSACSSAWRPPRRHRSGSAGRVACARLSAAERCSVVASGSHAARSRPVIAGAVFVKAGFLA